METEQILSEIKTKVGETNISDRSFTDYIETHLPKGAEPDDAFYEKAVKLFKSFQGNISHFAATTVREQAEAKFEEFKKNYKPTTTTQAETTKVETPPSGDDEWKKRLEELENAYKNEKKANADNSLRSVIKSKADELKVANKALWNDVVESIQIKEDTTAEKLQADVKNTYEQKLKAYNGEGAVPYGSTNRSGSAPISSKEAEAKREEFKKKMQSAGRLPKPKE